MLTWSRFCMAFLLLWCFFSFSLQVSAQNNPTPQAFLLANNDRTLIPFNPQDYPGVNFDTIVGDRSGSQGVVDTARNLLSTIKKALAPVLVLFIAWFGVRLVIAGGNEEKFSAASQHFFYLLVGTAFVVFADFLSQTFFLYRDGVSFVSNQEQIVNTASVFQRQIELLIKFLRYVLGGLAVFYVIKSGSVILFSGDDELVSKQKDVFMYGFMGFLLIMISEALVGVIFNLQTLPGVPFGEMFVSQNVNVGGGLSLLNNLTNLFLAAMTGLFLFMLVAGGVLYAFSAGNEERGQKATKIITGSLIGLVIAFSSYTIVSEFSSGGNTLRQANPVITPIVSPSTPNPAP